MRRLRERDREAVRVHFLSLSQSDRELRFGQPKPDRCLESYVDSVDFDKHPMYGVFGAAGRIVAILEVTPCYNDVAAEIAISVLSSAQRKGIGSALFMRGLELVRAMGRGVAVFQFLSINQAMRKIAWRHNALMRAEAGEVDCEIAV